MPNASRVSTVHVNLNPIFGVLGIVFVVLKLCHIITWSWWLVLLPFYISWVITIPFALIVLVIVVIDEVVTTISQHFRRLTKDKRKN